LQYLTTLLIETEYLRS